MMMMMMMMKMVMMSRDEASMSNTQLRVSIHPLLLMIRPKHARTFLSAFRLPMRATAAELDVTGPTQDSRSASSTGTGQLIGCMMHDRRRPMM